MRFALVLSSVALIAAAGPLDAGETPKPPAITQGTAGATRTILQKFDVPGTNYESTFMKVQFAPNLDIPRHTHPGPEASLILEGEITLLFQGQESRLLKAGDSVYFPPAIIHSGKAGPNGATLLNSYILEKGKPLLTLVDENGVPIP